MYQPGVHFSRLMHSQGYLELLKTLAPSGSVSEDISSLMSLSEIGFGTDGAVAVDCDIFFPADPVY